MIVVQSRDDFPPYPTLLYFQVCFRTDTELILDEIGVKFLFKNLDLRTAHDILPQVLRISGRVEQMRHKRMLDMFDHVWYDNRALAEVAKSFNELHGSCVQFPGQIIQVIQ